VPRVAEGFARCGDVGAGCIRGMGEADGVIVGSDFVSGGGDVADAGWGAGARD
jgi:hypothetical protein